MSSIGDLKKNMQEKIKSLKRRKGSDGLRNGLNAHVADLNSVHDFCKKLQSSAQEGRQLYDALINIPQVAPGTAVWQRVLKALALEAGLCSQNSYSLQFCSYSD